MFKITHKKMLEIKNNIFLKYGVPELEKNGFIKSPFKGAWHGQYYKSINGYIYNFCRIINKNNLETLDIYIVSGDKYIKIFLNIFEIYPSLENYNILRNYEGIKFKLNPNNIKEIRLRNDEYKGPPLFYMLFLPEHKIGRYYTETGFNNQVKKLEKLITKDMKNIDYFIKKWHKIHKPNLTDWEGNLINQ